mgnify:CR=1 FL=1
MTEPRCEKCHVPPAKDVQFVGMLAWTCRRCGHFNVVSAKVELAHVKPDS